MLKKYFPFLLILFFSISAFASVNGIPERPSPPRLVNNLSKEMPDFLSADETARLEQKLSDFANQTSNQIVIVIVDDLGGDEPWSYATELGQKWGVGQGKFDNGVVILVKPTGGEGQRNLFIGVGYGLEGAIPDLTTKQIRENEMYPYFAKGEYFTALDKATDVLMALAKGEYNSDAYGRKNKKKFPRGVIIPIILFILFIIFRASKGGRGGGGGLTMGAAGFILGSGLGHRGGGGFGGGGSSGGFGGFGGGGFGGGGSGGNW
jgi:uncharacterized protein